ncbi:MAG: alanine racemase [Gammaproteobacteria bacterium]|nr:alanine racemase [Gammaproteobacteria bacterium]NNM01801.1 alanine racemase [Gammaproteobacteria bacterium]
MTASKSNLRSSLREAVGHPGAEVLVDLDALAQNFRTMADIATPGQCGAVVKADAYGLGAAMVSRRLQHEGCTTFFVQSAEEGAALRAELAEPIIYVFNGVTPGSGETLLANRLRPVLSTPQQIERWRALRSAPGGADDLPAALHIDTGMTRLGLSPRDAHALLDAPGGIADLGIELLMTHLACASDADDPLNAAQIDTFAHITDRLPGLPTSIGASGGVLLGEAFRGDIARPGIALFGGESNPSRPATLAPVVTWLAPVLQLRDVTETLPVGYGATYVIEAPARVATVAAGYADGYPLSLSNAGIVVVAGQRVPVIGRVSMDMITVDVSALPRGAVAEGDRVEIIGEHMLLDEVAQRAGTSNYTILTGLGPRLPRRYLGRDD